MLFNPKYFNENGASTIENLSFVVLKEKVQSVVLERNDFKNQANFIQWVVSVWSESKNGQIPGKMVTNYFYQYKEENNVQVLEEYFQEEQLKILKRKAFQK